MIMIAILNFLLRNQIMIGMLAALCIFVPRNNARKLMPLRAILSAAAAVCFSAFVPIPMPWGLLAYFAIIALIIYFCFSCGFKHVLFAATCAYCVQHMASKLSYIFLALWLHADGVFVIYNFYWVCFFVLLLVHAAVISAVYFGGTRKFLKNRELEFDRVKTLVYTAVFIVFAVFLSYFAEDTIEPETYLIGYISLNAICALFAFLILSMNFMNCRGERLESEKRTLEALVKNDRKQYELVKRSMERINIRYHDIKQQHSASMDEEEQRRLDSEIDSFQSLYNTGNRAVDITLYGKATMCSSAGIQLLCTVDGSCLNMLKPYHIYSLLGNALDNAIEALRAADEDKRVIRLDVWRRADMSVIRVSNYTASEIRMEDGLPVTTKADGEDHGYGIKSIKNIAEQYGGMMYITVKDHEFVLIVTFPSAEKAEK